LLLGLRHQIVDHFLGHEVLEDVGQVGFGRFERCQFQVGQPRQAILQARLVHLGRIDASQHAIGKDAPDDAGDLDRELLLRRQAIDAAGNNSLDGVGEGQRRQIGAWRQSRPAVLDEQQSGVAQGVGQLLAEEGVPLRLVVDKGNDSRRQFGHP